MSSSAQLGELRSLLAQGPSCFVHLCDLLEGASPEVISYVYDHVSGWPPETRRMPGAWFSLGPGERALWRLCDVVCLADEPGFSPDASWTRALGALSEVMYLDMAGAGVTRASLEALAPWMGRLRVLELGANDFVADDIACLCVVPGPWALNLEDNRLGDEGAAWLASAPWGALVHLNLSCNEIADAGARALAKAPGLTSLETLNLWCNEVGEEGQRALGARWGALSWLQLADNAPDGPVERCP